MVLCVIIVRLCFSDLLTESMEKGCKKEETLGLKIFLSAYVTR